MSQDKLKFVCAAILAVAFAAGAAQKIPSDRTPNTNPPPAKGTGSSEPRSAIPTTTPTGNPIQSVTGCLQKGSKSEFTLKAADGQTWSVESDTAKLNQHVGHTVTVTGDVPQLPQERASSAGSDVSGQAKSPAQAPTHIRATKLTMVDTSCGRTADPSRNQSPN